MDNNESPKNTISPLRYTQPIAYRNIPFDESWLTVSRMPFGLEDWALEYLARGDFVTGIRVVYPSDVREPITYPYRVKMEHDGTVDIQLEVSDCEFFSLRGPTASLIRRGERSLCMAKWWAYLDRDDVRHWQLQWERRIVDGTRPTNIVPATNALCLDSIMRRLLCLAANYRVSGYDKWTWVDAVFPDRVVYGKCRKEHTPTEHHMKGIMKELALLEGAFHAGRFTIDDGQAASMIGEFTRQCTIVMLPSLIQRPDVDASDWMKRAVVDHSK